MEVNEGRMAPLVASQTLTPRPHPLFRAGILEPPPPQKSFFSELKMTRGYLGSFTEAAGILLLFRAKIHVGNSFLSRMSFFPFFFFVFFLWYRPPILTQVANVTSLIRFVYLR